MESGGEILEEVHPATMSTEALDGLDSVPPLHSDDSLALDRQSRNTSQTQSEDTVLVLALESFPSVDNIPIHNSPNLERVPDHGLNDNVTQISDVDTALVKISTPTLR